MSSVTIKAHPTRPHYPPGPQGNRLLGTIGEFSKDPIGTLIRYHQQYGDAIHYHFFLHYYGYSFTHPDHLKHILQENNKNYTKQPHPTNQLLRPFAGNGLLTSDGDDWLWQRRMAQPAFHRRRLTSFATTMTDAAQAMLERWDVAGRQAPFNVAEEFNRLTLEIAGKTLFSTDLTREARTVGDSFSQVNEEFTVLNVKPFGTIMARLPFFASSRRLQAGIKVLDEVVDKIIAERRRDNQQHDDLLAILMEARDEETGEGMDDKLLRDQVMTLMLAGHETTSVALSWIFHLLSIHPAVLEKLLAEVDEVLGGRVPTMEDMRDLVYTRMVIDEALRLYPPAYAMARWANEADVVGGYDVAANSAVTLVSYLTHRNPEFWPEPEKFNPQRFSAENVAGRPRFAYVPFGGGPRQCIGNTFALTEATLLLATIVQRYRPEPVPGHKPELEPLITLRPKGGMPLAMRPRQI